MQSTRLDKSPIKPLEANDLIFELALPDYLGQDGSGEKGFGLLSRSS
jgi:hypothetical protein